MSNPDLIEFLKTPWSAEAESLLQEATGSNPSYTVNELRFEVESGKSRLMAVVDHNTGKPLMLGYIVAWIEPFGGNRELVLQAGAAFTNTLQKASYIAPALRRLMNDNQCVSMRAHTDNKAMARALRRAGFVQAEVVMRFGA